MPCNNLFGWVLLLLQVTYRNLGVLLGNHRIVRLECLLDLYQLGLEQLIQPHRDHRLTIGTGRSGLAFELCSIVARTRRRRGGARG